MRIDTYAKTILTLIALLLGVVAFRPLLRPQMTAYAQGISGTVQFTGAGENRFWAIDRTSGKVWEYNWSGFDTSTTPARPKVSVTYLGKLGEVGKEMVFDIPVKPFGK